jgi:DNA-binding PadR family transcriptional regulator
MFRHFRFSTPPFACAGVSQEELPLISYLFLHGRHRSGRCHDKPFGDEFFNQGWKEESRTRRGDIKFILLELLSEHPSHGYDLIKEMETRYGGFRKLSPGSVYPTLQMLEEGGYLTSATEGGKRIYTITEEGRQLLGERSQRQNPDTPWEPFQNRQELRELRHVATELASLLIQVARRGNNEEIRRVRELLDQVKRDIYLMLAER